MTYKYKVTLTGIKGFYRVYKIDGNTTLYSFHKQMRSDMEFPQDQLILFKGLDSAGDLVARFGLFDLGAGAADQISISQTIKNGITSFVYFYDVTNRKSVNISFEGECAESAPEGPALIDIKGPNPIDFENGYVAFEDLPAEQRHLPGEDEDRPKKKSKLEDLLNISLDDLDDLDEDGDEDDLDEDEDDEEDDEEEGIFGGEEGQIIYDGSEQLPL